jgi:hypothetical protein
MSSKVIVSFLAAVGCLSAQALPQGVQKKSSLGGITEYSFPNGLRVLLFPDASNPKITVNMTYLVGSRHEGYGETGTARSGMAARTTTAPTTTKRSPQATKICAGLSAWKRIAW